jgi:hypothetical protein
MKRLLVVVMILFSAAGAFALPPTYTFDQFQSAFKDFASGVASALPLDSSVGLNWSDAYIGQFPHFGIGATVGAATVPFSAVNKAITAFGGTVPSNLGFLSSVGIPLPAYTIDLRIGGFSLPFDIGLKFGYLPPDAFSGSFKADYLLVGGDIRYALLKDKGFTPGLSVGVGYTYMRGTVSLPGVLSGPIDISNVTFGGQTYTLGFTDPSLRFAWDTNVIDLKLQLSKNLLLITPYVGAGLSYGISHAGGGMQSAMTLNGIPVTQSQLDQMNSTFGTNFTLQNPGFAVSEGASGISARVFGGLSLNLFILKIGVGAEYELLSGSFAGMANVRLQF